MTKKVSDTSAAPYAQRSLPHLYTHPKGVVAQMDNAQQQLEEMPTRVLHS
ncbi:unnamed protein product [Miscanthus lutarioriparius]|uniref:Uncharacterized protein n=1 Tax=Miscanthus lutarioriparius TaxID=422564 RepID=A0A811PLE3_9POAL|nr:unnamed protein product [Miscanthus lutarioriparius]